MNAHNSSTEKNIPKSYNINSIKNMNGKENNVIFNRNKIIDGPNNFLNKTTQMTNSKTRLLTECSKRNSSKNINLGYRNNTSYKNKNVGTQIKNMKHSSFSRNINQVNKTNDKYQKNAILNTLYYNYRDNVDTNFLQNNYLNYNKNKIAFSFEQPNEIINNEGNFYSKEENKYENEKDIEYNNKNFKKSKFEKNPKYIQEIIIDSNKKNNYNNNSNCHFRENDGYEANKRNHNINIDYDYSNGNNIIEKSIKRKKNNGLLSYDKYLIKKVNENLLDKNNIENNYNTCGNYKTQRKRRVKENNYINKNDINSLNSINNSNKKRINKNDINNKNNINYLLQILNVNDINEAIIRVRNLLDYEKDLNKLKQLYNIKDKYNFEKNDLWVSKIIKSYKINEKYKNFCQNIMILNKIKTFEKFKVFIIDNLPKYKKDINNEDNNNLNINYEEKKFKNSKEINLIDNKLNRDNYTINSDDINFSNSNNYKRITEYMHTYY